MQTRSSKLNWMALCAGLLFVWGPADADAGGCWWNKWKCKNKDADVCQEDCPGNCPADCKDGTDCCKKSRFRKLCDRCKGRGCRACWGASDHRCQRPVDPTYCDSRDLNVYAAVGYNVPVTVPLAPVCRIYNYSWG